MSALTGVSNSDGIAYATQLAQTSALNRSLSNLGTAIQNGDLASAGSILSAVMTANPQFASTSTDGTASQDPINQDFQALSNAVSNNQVDSAKSAWTQLKTDLAASGVSITNNSAATAAQLLAQNKESEVQELLGALFGNGSSGSVSSLIGASSASATSPDLSSIVSNWLAYKADGNVSPTTAADTGAASIDATA
jgi:hypothetical protein